jgi:hypothetical protein
MARIRDWKGMRDRSARLLKERTGEDVDVWNRRMQPSKIHEAMRLQISFTRRDEVDSEALDWLQRAYDQNR